MRQFVSFLCLCDRCHREGFVSFLRLCNWCHCDLLMFSNWRWRCNHFDRRSRLDSCIYFNFFLIGCDGNDRDRFDRGVVDRFNGNSWDDFLAGQRQLYCASLGINEFLSEVVAGIEPCAQGASPARSPNFITVSPVGRSR